MKHKEILVFGASGHIGRHLIRKLTKNNFKVTAAVRNFHRKAYILKTQGNPGYLDIVETNIYDLEAVNSLVKKADICINLVGILYETKNNTFENIHSSFPSVLAKLCHENNLDQLIHVSALGVEKALDSKYAKSKSNGEKLIKQNFLKSTILKPSIVYSVDDNFTTNFMTLLSILPAFPLYYNGKTKFNPIHVSDLTEIILQTINQKIYSNSIECCGPDTLTFKEIIQKLLNSIDKKRLLIPMPISLAKISAKMIETFMSKPLITVDQLNLLKYDNTPTGDFKTNFDFNINAEKKFEQEIEKYSYMWKDSGEYSKNKQINKL